MLADCPKCKKNNLGFASGGNTRLGTVSCQVICFECRHKGPYVWAGYFHESWVWREAERRWNAAVAG